MRTEYLGDGVYAKMDESDPQMVWLWTERWDVERQKNVVHKIALEPNVFSALVKFMAGNGVRA